VGWGKEVGVDPVFFLMEPSFSKVRVTKKKGRIENILLGSGL